MPSRSLVLLCLLLSLASVGCAGGDSASVSAPSTLPAPPLQGTVVGRLFLGRDVPASVTVQALDGSLLGQARARQGGCFAVRNAALPADFRVVARLEGSTQDFVQEVRGYRGGNLYVAPNVPTTLASLYLKASGGSLEEAEARVRRGLSLPLQTSLAYGVEETPRSSFSHLAFFRAAGLAGGWEPFSAEMVRRLQTGAVSSFVLTRAEVSRPLTGLEPGLQARMERVRTWLQAYLVFSDGVDLGLPRRSRGSSIVARGLFGDAGLSIATGMIGNWLTVGFTAAANAMGWNTGTAAQLQEIQQTLDLIQNEITALNVSVSQLALGTDEQTLQENAINPILVATQSIQEALDQVGTSQSLPNVPFTPTGEVADMLGQVGNYTTNVNLADIQDAMLGSGSTNLILTAQNLTVPIYGLDQPASLQGFPYRCNNLLAAATQTYSLYEGYQLEALNLLAEFAHNSPDPAGAVNTNLDTLINATLSLKAQRQQQPIPLPSDSVILDLEYGVMWYNGVYSPATYDVALSVADSFVLQGTLVDGSSITYDDWRLPTSAEIQALQNRGAYNPLKQGDPDGTVPTASDDAYPDFGQVTSGLPQLGFVGVANAFNAANEVGSNNPGNDGDVWFQYWEQGDGDTFLAPLYYFFSLNQTRNNMRTASATEEAPFLLCRTVSQPLMNPLAQYIDVEGDTITVTPSDQPGSAPLPSPVVGTPLVPAEYIHYGTVSAVGAPTAGPAVAARPSPYPGVPAGALQLSSQVTGTLTMGGTFSQGAQGTIVNQTVASLTQVGSPTSTTTAAGTPSDLARLISFIPQQSSANAIIWNSEGLDGLVILRQGSSLGVAAGFGSLSSVGTVSGNLTPGTVSALGISPRNQQYLTFPTSPILYYCTGFCSNMTVLSLGNNVTWSLAPGNLGLSVGPTGQNSAQILGRPTLQPSPTLQTFTLIASLNGLSDQTQFQVQMPVGVPSPTPSAGPVISTLTPAFGTAAGGTPVRISGSNFLGVTSVTFGGTAAQFSVDTSTQITVFATPPGLVGAVQVSVTSPAGTGVANYTYTQ